MNNIEQLSSSIEFITSSNILIKGLSNIVESDKHYLIYKITNLINGKYYIGLHLTKNPYDTYMGSGKLIKKAIEKYHLSAFVKEFLFDFNSYDEMNNKEHELVPLSACYPVNISSYNLCEGGKYGLKNEESIKLGVKNYKETIKNTPMDVLKNRYLKIGKSVKKFWKTHPEEAYRKGGRLKTKGIPKTKEWNLKNSKAHKGKIFTEEQRLHMCKNHANVTGKNNPAYGRKWMLNVKTLDIIYVNQTDVKKFLDVGYIFGTKEVKKLISSKSKIKENHLKSQIAGFKSHYKRFIKWLIWLLYIINF